MVEFVYACYNTVQLRLYLSREGEGLMKKCKECGAGNDDIETKCVLCGTRLPVLEAGGVIRNPRKSKIARGTTGPYEKVGSRREGLRNADPEAFRLPVKDGNRIVWTGSRAQLGGFRPKVRDAVLEDADVGGGLYKCAKCGDEVRKKDDPAWNQGEAFITIDHKVSIRDYVLGHTTKHAIVSGGHNFDIYYLDECKSAHETVSNLVAMCNSCNSSKGGNKDLDGEMRDHDRHTCQKCNGS